MLKRHRTDGLAGGGLLVAVLAVMAVHAVKDDWLFHYDILTFFLPWYGYLGDQISAGELPAWMPLLSSGSPMAGDPSGGWWYLPAMLAFPLFNVATAFKVMITIQALLGAVGTYVFSRQVGLSPLSAVASAAALVFGPMIAAATTFGTVAGQTTAWVPIGLMAIEFAIRSERMASRMAWIGLCGFSLGQTAVSWPGQGLYAATLLIGGWAAYRALLWPLSPKDSIRDRIEHMLLLGIPMAGFLVLLSAAGLFPRFEASNHSNIPHGDYSGVVGGNYIAEPHTFMSLLRDTFADNFSQRPVSITMTVLVLSFLAVILGRWRFGVPYFATVVVLAGMLSLREGPLHEIAYLLPGFESLQQHSPRRFAWTLTIAPAMLAGAGLESIIRWRPGKWSAALTVIPATAVLAIWIAMENEGVWIGWWPIGLAALAIGLIEVMLLAERAPVSQISRDRIVRGASVAILLTIMAVPTVPDMLRPSAQASPPSLPASECFPRALSTTDPGGAGEFLQQQQALGVPFRIVSYAGRDPSTTESSYSSRRCVEEVLNSLAGERSVRLGLETVQGYNPMHLGYYAEYIDAMNGGQQDYHWVDPYPHVLAGSQMMDMLNVRYIVVGLGEWTDQEVVAAIASQSREVFRTDKVVVFENPNAFDRAWIVHEVRPNGNGEALQAFGSGLADGHAVAYVNGPLPVVEPVPPGGESGEVVTVVSKSSTRVEANVQTSAAGLVVFSQAYDAGWTAKVDGKDVPVIRANHALQGVAVSAGAHTIELVYEPDSLRYGLILSLAGLGIWGGLIGMAALEWGKRRQVTDVFADRQASNQS